MEGDLIFTKILIPDPNKGKIFPYLKFSFRPDDINFVNNPLVAKW